MKLRSKKNVYDKAHLKTHDSYRDQIVKKYTNNYLKYHYSPKTLGWPKGRQDIRFEILLSFFECKGKKILDIGCGFGSLGSQVRESYGSRTIGIEFKGSKDDAFKFMDSLRIIDISNNLGDSKSLITHPASTTHRRLSPEVQAEMGITPSVLRLSVGLEHVDDLIKDLDQALKS